MNQTKEIVPFDIKELTENNIALMQTQCREMVIDEKGKGYVEVKAAHVKVKGLKRAVTDRHKERKAIALKECQDLDGERRRLYGLLDPIIDTLASKRQVEDDRKTEIRAAKQRIEQNRVDGIRAKIDRIKQWCYQGLGYGVSSENIEKLLPMLESTLAGLMEVDYMEFLGEAKDLLRATIVNTQTALEARLQWEKEETERKAEAEKLAEIRKQQEVEQERLENERLALLTKRQKLEDKERRQEEEIERKEFERQATKRAEKEAAEKIEREAKEAEEKKAAEAAEKTRLEALKPDIEKLLDFAQTLHDMEWPEVKGDAMAQVVIEAKQVVWKAIEVIRGGVRV